MRSWRWLVSALLIGGLLACNRTVGQCWIDDQGDTGGPGQEAGGGAVLPYGGAGGSGDQSKKPLDAADSQEPPECNSIGTYSSSLFKFVTTVADGGQDVGGGYQEATASNVKFVDGRQDPPAAWTCNIWVGMPLRTQALGKISAERAAEIAADALTDAASPTMHSKDAWVPGAFCKKLAENMVLVFSQIYKVKASARGQ